jgi:alpha-glucosidase
MRSHMTSTNLLPSIHHDGSRRYVKPQALRLNDIGTIRLRAHPQTPIERVLLRTCPDGEQVFVAMQPRDVNAVYRWWEASIKVTMPLTGYRFLLFTADGVWWYNGTGLHRHVPTDLEDFKLLADYEAPAWVRASVFYQIFPDRFADGDPANNVRDGEWNYGGRPSHARRWGEPPSDIPHADMVEFFGGDLQGVEQHLDDLIELGVNALYFTPIFTSYSNHRYDVVDYENVDPHLGGDEALISLRRAMRERQMRLMLDIVPNHCGLMHPWFQAALKDPSAPTAEFFTFYHHPDEYESWLGVRSLPKLNYRSAALRQAMYEGPQAIFRKWLRESFSIDAWRIDVANMLARTGADQLGHEIGQGIRRAVKEENSQAYLLGENFFDGSAQLQGDIWDAVMNYAGFAHPLWYWLGGFFVRQHTEPYFAASDAPWSTQALIDTWRAYRAAVPWAITQQQFNLLGTHDTARICHVVNGHSDLNRLAVALLLTYPGVPCVYYGDEIGLDGDTRACMNWDRAGWDHDLRAFYQTMIRLRKTSPALIDGGFQVLLIEENTFAYLRDSDRDAIIVVAQRGATRRSAVPLPVAHGAIPDGTEFVEVISGAHATVECGHLPLPEMPAGVLLWRSTQ